MLIFPLLNFENSFNFFFKFSLLLKSYFKPFQIFFQVCKTSNTERNIFFLFFSFRSESAKHSSTATFKKYFELFLSKKEISKREYFFQFLKKNQFHFFYNLFVSFLIYLYCLFLFFALLPFQKGLCLGRAMPYCRQAQMQICSPF